MAGFVVVVFLAGAAAGLGAGAECVSRFSVGSGVGSDAGGWFASAAGVGGTAAGASAVVVAGEYSLDAAFRVVET